MQEEYDFIRAAEQTWVVRYPRQRLDTFGATSLAYYVVTEPIYRDMDPHGKEGVVRTGKVVAQKPSIVTPHYAMSLDGFSDDAYEYFQHLSDQFGPNSPGILYKYTNEPEGTEILSGEPSEIAGRIDDDLTRKDENLAVVMVGVDEFWDVSLLKFIYEYTSGSAPHNVKELESRGLLAASPGMGGLPAAAVQRIERMFGEVQNGRDPETVKRELDRWGAFEYYEDRFLNLFRRRR